MVHEKYSASTWLGAWKLPTGFIHVLRSQTIRRVHGMILALIAMSVIEERLVALWQSEEILQELSKRSRRMCTCSLSVCMM